MNDRTPPLPARLTCAEVEPLLVDALTGELDPARTAGVREHLAGCAACQAAVAEVQATLALLRDAWQDGPPVPQQLSTKHRERLWWGLAHPVREWIYLHHTLVSFIVGVLALAAMLIVLRGVGAWSERQPPPEGIAVTIGVGETNVPPGAAEEGR